MNNAKEYQHKDILILIFLVIIASVAITFEWFEGSINPFLFFPFLLILFFALYSSMQKFTVLHIVFQFISVHILVYSSGGEDSALYFFYFIPILLSAREFGLKGSGITGIAVTIAYSMFFYDEDIEKIHAELIEETITFIFISVLSGFLIDRIRIAEERKEEENRLAQLGLFSSQIAHEFRNPLQIISGAADTILKKNWITDEGRIFLNDILNVAKRMTILVKDFLDFGRPVIRSQDNINLNEIIEESAKKAEIHLVFITNRQFVTKADSTALERVFFNLFDNAKKAGADKIECKLELSLDKIVILISDNGSGINEKENEILFQPFRSGKKGGTGLGLPIASKLISLHKGSIKFAGNNDMGGAVFKIIIPAVKK